MPFMVLVDQGVELPLGLNVVAHSELTSYSAMYLLAQAQWQSNAGARTTEDGKKAADAT